MNERKKLLKLEKIEKKRRWVEKILKIGKDVLEKRKNEKIVDGEKKIV